VRFPGRECEAGSERHTERAEVAGHVLLRAVGRAPDERRDALGEHHDRHPRQGRTQPSPATEAGRSSPSGHCADEIGDGFGGADTNQAFERGEPLGVVTAGGADREMVVDDSLFLGCGLAIGTGGDEVADGVAVHTASSRRTAGIGSPAATLNVMDHLTKLLLAARDGDRAALERFIAETQANVWRLCRYLGDAQYADDLAQESYERAIASIHRYRADGPARGWLLTIVRRTCVDHTRRAIRRRRLDATLLHDAAAGSPVGTLVSADFSGRVDLDEVLGALDEDRRAAFVLTQVLGLHYDEAADILGCPVGTIRSRVSRARAGLLEMMHDPAGETDSLRQEGA
jgi:RNA polymerase sigma-70 factor, ECF subfamily